MIVCADDTFLFNTNISMEFFEYAKAVGKFGKEELKAHLMRNVDAIFLDDEDYKDHLKNQIIAKF